MRIIPHLGAVITRMAAPGRVRYISLHDPGRLRNPPSKESVMPIPGRVATIVGMGLLLVAGASDAPPAGLMAAARARARPVAFGRGLGFDLSPQSDPPLVYSTYYGGCRGRQGIQDVATDAAGNAYVTGDYPWDCDRGPADVYVSKFSPTGALL